MSSSRPKSVHEQTPPATSSASSFLDFDAHGTARVDRHVEERTALLDGHREETQYGQPLSADPGEYIPRQMPNFRERHAR